MFSRCFLGVFSVPAAGALGAAPGALRAGCSGAAASSGERDVPAWGVLIPVSPAWGQRLSVPGVPCVGCCGFPGGLCGGAAWLRGVPGCRGSCVGCPWAQHPCLCCPRDERRCCPQRGLSGGAREVPTSPGCLTQSFGVPVSLPWGAQHPTRASRRSEQHGILHPRALTRGAPRGVGTHPCPPSPPTPPGALAEPQPGRDEGPRWCRGRCRYTGSDCAVLMSATHPRQLCAFPFFCLLLLFFFFSLLLLPCCSARLVLEPRFQPHRAPSALVYKFSGQVSLKCGWPGPRGVSFSFLPAEKGEIMDSLAP